MNHDREIGVSEARFGLTLLICLLLALGYMILHRLGDTGRMPPIEIRPGLVTQPRTAPDDVSPTDVQQPQVLTIESSDPPATTLRTSQRPDSRAPDDRDAEALQLSPPELH